MPQFLKYKSLPGRNAWFYNNLKSGNKVLFDTFSFKKKYQTDPAKNSAEKGDKHRQKNLQFS